MREKLNILLVEDSDSDAEMLVRFLQKRGIEFSYTRVWDKATFLHVLNANEYDLIIADYSLPQFNGMEAFRYARNANKDIPFILITGSVSEELLTRHAKEGIDDYLLKNNLLRLPSAIERVVNKKRVEKLNDSLTEANHKLTSAYDHIRDSINYAKVLQEAILPNDAL